MRGDTAASTPSATTATIAFAGQEPSERPPPGSSVCLVEIARIRVVRRLAALSLIVQRGTRNSAELAGIRPRASR
jgi:hypothetical protein